MVAVEVRSLNTMVGLVLLALMAVTPALPTMRERGLRVGDSILGSASPPYPYHSTRECTCGGHYGPGMNGNTTHTNSTVSYL